MKKLLILIIVLAIAPKTLYSQHLSITKTERDSIVFKIIRGNKAQEENKVLRTQITKRDSIISVCDNLTSVSQSTISTLKEININLQEIIGQKDIIIGNTQKIAKKKHRIGLLKGGAIGIVLGYFVFK